MRTAIASLVLLGLSLTSSAVLTVTSPVQAASTAAEALASKINSAANRLGFLSDSTVYYELDYVVRVRFTASDAYAGVYLQRFDMETSEGGKTVESGDLSTDSAIEAVDFDLTTKVENIEYTSTTEEYNFTSS